MFRANQVANLCPDQGTRPSGVLLDHQLVPDTELGIALHANQLKRLNLPSCRGKVAGFFYWLFRPSGSSLPRLPSGLRQLKSLGPLQFPKGLKATGSLRLAQGIEETKVLAHPLCNSRARGISVVF